LSVTKLFVRSLPCQKRARRHAREGKRDRRAFSRCSLSRASGQPVPTCHYESFKFKSTMKELTFSLSSADYEMYTETRDTQSLFVCLNLLLFNIFLTWYKYVLLQIFYFINFQILLTLLSNYYYFINLFRFTMFSA